MSKSARRITEKTLERNFNELAHSLVRELAMACKKMAIYGSTHPLARKAVGPPFLILGQIFHYKNNATLNVRRGELYIFNIALKETIFNSQIMQFLQILDINAIIFESRVTLEELTIFVDALVKRDTLYDPKYRLSQHLQKNKIDSIQVNSSLAFELFEKRKLYRGEVDGDYSVRRLALDQLGDDLSQIAGLLVSDKDFVEQGIDFDPAIVKYLIPERVASFSVEEFVEAIRKAAQSGINDEAHLALLALAESHPNSDAIRSQLDSGQAPSIKVESVVDPVISIQHESRDRVDKLISELFQENYEPNDILEFSGAFSRLLKTGQLAKANGVTDELLQRLADGEPRTRQMALSLLDGAIGAIQSANDAEVIEHFIKDVSRRLAEKSETFEYSELIRLLFGKCLKANFLSHLADLCASMTTHRQLNDNVTVYESLVVKKALEQINRMDVIESLIDRLVDARHEDAAHLKTILCTIGSEEVALALSRIISHPLRQVRQQALRILADLGMPALTVFSRMMADDQGFKRDDDRQDLPDPKWYVVRNTIFVLGSLRDLRGVDALRLRLSDSDIRVRREIICALEKIGGDEAVDLLILLADDSSSEIRGASLIAIGLIAKPEVAPLVIDVAHRHPTEVIKAVTALGKLGGEEVIMYLSQLLQDQEEFTRLSAGKVSKDELRVAVIKALAAVSPDKGRDQIRDFRDGMSKTQKIFFKNSSVNKTINEILSRK